MPSDLVASRERVMELRATNLSFDEMLVADIDWLCAVALAALDVAELYDRGVDLGNAGMRILILRAQLNRS